MNDPFAGLKPRRNDDPFAGLKPRREGSVTLGPVEPTGSGGRFELPAVPVELAREVDPIQTAFRVAAQAPRAGVREFQRGVRERAAPTASGTAASIALGEVVAPVLPGAAEFSTDEAIRRFVEGGGDAADNANLFGAASAVGAVGGNVGLGYALPNVGTLRAGMAPREIGAALLKGTLSEGAIGGGIAGAGALAEGATPGEAARFAGEQFVVQGLLGGAIRGLQGAPVIRGAMRGAPETVSAADVGEALGAPKAPLMEMIREKVADAVHPEGRNQRIRERRQARTDTRTGLGSRLAFDEARAALDADPSVHWASLDARGIGKLNNEVSPDAADAFIAETGRIARVAAEEVGIPAERVFSPKGDEFLAAGTEAQVRRWQQLMEERVPKEWEGRVTGVRGGVGRTVADADQLVNTAKAAEKAIRTPVDDLLAEAQTPRPPKPARGSVEDLQARADAEGIEVRAAGVSEPPLPLPSNPGVNIRLMRDADIDQMQASLDRALNDPTVQAQLADAPELHGRLLADREALAQARRDRMRVAAPVREPAGFLDETIGSREAVAVAPVRGTPDLADGATVRVARTVQGKPTFEGGDALYRRTSTDDLLTKYQTLRTRMLDNTGRTAGRNDRSTAGRPGRTQGMIANDLKAMERAEAELRARGYNPENLLSGGELMDDAGRLPGKGDAFEGDLATADASFDPRTFAEGFFGESSDLGEEGMIGAFGLRSRLPRSIQAAKLEKAPAQTWVSKLRGAGNAASEFDWVVGEVLRRDPTRVWTKAELLDLANGKGIKVTERVLGKDSTPYDARTVSWSPSRAGTFEMAAEGRPSNYGIVPVGEGKYAVYRNGDRLRDMPDADSARQYAEEMFRLDNPVGGGAPKFASYQEPGGTNYREVLVKLEGQEGASEFQSQHWDDPNVLVHLRMNDRVGPDGSKVLFVEEIQSDWMQKGRKEGFRGDVTVTPTKAVRRNGLWEVQDAEGRFITNVQDHDLRLGRSDPRGPVTEADAVGEARRRFVDGERGRLSLRSDSVPDAPGMFKDTPQWTLLGLKRALDEAVAGGYERLAWTTGEQQAARYDLSKRLRDVDYDPESNTLSAGDHEGSQVLQQWAAPEDLPNIIGKEAAERLLRSPLQDGVYRLSGEDLRVGGEGMKGYYDRILPETLRAYGKKLGVRLEVEPMRVGEVTTLGGEVNMPPQQPSIRITPELRDRIRGGQELGTGAPRILAGTAGGLGGAAYGYTQGDTPEERARNALLYGLGGLAAGVAVGRFAERAGELDQSGMIRLSATSADDVSRAAKLAERIERRAPKVTAARTEFAAAPTPRPTVGGDTPYVNLTKFGLEEEANTRLRQEAERIGQELQGQPRRVATWEEWRAAASSLGVTDVTRGDFKAMGADKLLALRNIIADNTDRLIALDARMADRGLSASERSVLALEQQALDSQNDLLLRRFIPARTEAGRRLNSLRMMANRTFDPSWWLSKATDVKGEPLTDLEAATLRKHLASGDRVSLVQAVSELRRSTLGQKAATYWKANLLTSPMTHAVNITSNAALQAGEIASDLPGALFDTALSLATGRRTTAAPSLRQAQAAASGAMEGIRQAKLALRGVPMAEDLAKYDIPRETNFDNPVLDAYTKTVFRLLGAEDRVFRMAATRRALANQAEVVARTEGLSGEAYQARVEELIAHPTSEMSLNAVAEAEQAVVTDETAIGQALGGIRRVKVGDVPVGEFLMPFTRTPGAVATRVGEYAFGMPYGLTKIANRAVRGELQNLTPQEQRQLAKLLGRGTTGMGILAAGALLFKAGLLTAPSGEDAAERATDEMRGAQGVSLRIGDQQFALGRLSPVGNLLAVGAMAAQAAGDRDPESSPWGALALGAVKTITDQPFLQGVQNIADARRDPGRFGERLAGSVASGFVPAAALVGGVARTVDPTVRRADGVVETVQARLPFASRGLPAKIDPLGYPVDREGGILNEMVSPVRMRTLKRTPVLDALGEYEVTLNGFKPQTGESNEAFAQRAERSGTIREEELARALDSEAWTTDSSYEARKALLEQALRRAANRIARENRGAR